MKPYIMFNQDKRKQAKNNFEKDYYKLANNAVYGKTLENVRKRMDVKLTVDDRRKQKLVNSPWYKDFRCFGEGLFGIEMSKKSVVMNKPIAVGVSVLSWSKTRMFDFYYNVMKNKYEDRVHVHYTDTDSLFLSIRTEDLYKDIAEDLNMASHFDLQKYPVTHPLFTQFGNADRLLEIRKNNKDIFGKYKDESEGKIITEMCFIR